MQQKYTVLMCIARIFNEKGIRWAVGASLMLCLRGVVKDFNDLDILVDEADLEAARQILLGMGTLHPSAPNPDFCSKHFLEFTVGGVGVDLLAGFAVKKDGVIHRFPMEERHDHANVLGESIPMESLGRWRDCYEAMGRTEKMRLVEAALAERSRPWLNWAIELQAIAQNGLTYAKDIYDIERYSRLREISAEMLAHQGEIPVDRVKTLFCGESGYQTPKLDTRAAIFESGKILLVRENSGKWSLPGGWVDVNESIASNTVKEVWEEAGLQAEALRLIAVQDRSKHNLPLYAYGICKVFVLCRVLGGQFRENSETTASGYFALDELPPLAEEKNTAAQIALCFKAHADENWKVQFD